MYFVNRMNWHEAQQQYRHQQQQKSWVFLPHSKIKNGWNKCLCKHKCNYTWFRPKRITTAERSLALSLSLYRILNCNANVYINEIRFSFELTIVIGAKWTVTEPYRKAKKSWAAFVVFWVPSKTPISGLNFLLSFNKYTELEATKNVNATGNGKSRNVLAMFSFVNTSNSHG